VWEGEPGSSTLRSAHGDVFQYAGYENLWPGRYDKAEDAANMCLISAAPDLLEALKQVGNAYGCFAGCTASLAKPGECGQHTYSCSVARSAIAKAEGRS